MAHTLSPLPYDFDALAPHISARTVEIHYTKHHQGYVDKLNSADTKDRSLKEIIAAADGTLFNNAAQVWNHDFYWQSMAPAGDRSPTKLVADELKQHFGSVEAFKQSFAETAKGQFGSGWAWLVRNKNGELKVLSTSDAENPLRQTLVPLLTIDVWEHAYYLDHQNERGNYVEAWLDHLLNWQFLERNLSASAQQLRVKSTSAA